MLMVNMKGRMWPHVLTSDLLFGRRPGDEQPWPFLMDKKQIHMIFIL